MPGRLASPRFRRRALRGGLLLAVVASGALVSIFFWNTATVVETPLHGRADLYVPPIPVKMAAAERRQVIATAARFVETAVKRDHAERAYELVGPNLRNGTTLAHWREGDIPVVPYPVDDARWKFDYSYADEIGLQVAVFPEAGESVRPMVFNMSLRAVGAGAEAALAGRLVVAERRRRRAALVPAAPTARRSGSISSHRSPPRRASAPSGCSSRPA